LSDARRDAAPSDGDREDRVSLCERVGGGLHSERARDKRASEEAFAGRTRRRQPRTQRGEWSLLLLASRHHPNAMRRLNPLNLRRPALSSCSFEKSEVKGGDENGEYNKDRGRAVKS